MAKVNCTRNRSGCNNPNYRHGEGGHALSRTPLYRAWAHMKERCTNPSPRDAACYAGVFLCAEWHTFIPFRDWAYSHGYKKGLKLLRTDTRMGYEPSNCQWVTHTEFNAATAHRRKKHGHTINGHRTRLHRTWTNMKHRCKHPSEKDRRIYEHVTVCEEWRTDFTAFRDWALSHGYSDDLEIDRKDSNGPYSPDNCRWVTDRQQRLNCRGTSASGFRGVHKVGKYAKWTAAIGGPTSRIRLGTFNSPEEAARAYDTAAKKLYGTFATLNFPNE